MIRAVGITIFLFFIAFVLILFTDGGKGEEKRVKAVVKSYLEQKYDNEFNIISYDVRGESGITNLKVVSKDPKVEFVVFYYEDDFIEDAYVENLKKATNQNE